MSKIIDWINKTPNSIIFVSIATTLSLFIALMVFLAVAPSNSITSAIGVIIFIIWLFSVLGVVYACVKALDRKNRSFWWLGLFILFPLIGLIVILALDDHSEHEVSEIQQFR